MTTTRRDFLLKIAKGAVYAAPVVYTVAAPGTLLGQENETSSKGGMGMGMTKDVIEGPVAPGSSSPGTLPSAPWQAKPTQPVNRPPGGIRPGN